MLKTSIFLRLQDLTSDHHEIEFPNLFYTFLNLRSNVFTCMCKIWAPVGWVAIGGCFPWWILRFAQAVGSVRKGPYGNPEQSTQRHTWSRPLVLKAEIPRKHQGMRQRTCEGALSKAGQWWARLCRNALPFPGLSDIPWFLKTTRSSDI